MHLWVIRYFLSFHLHKMIKKLAFAIILTYSGASLYGQEQARPIYSSEVFTIFPDRVEQDRFTARALSRVEIASDYQSLGNDFIKPRIDFKFSINGKDNEM